MDGVTFNAVLESEADGHFFRVPAEVADQLGPRRRPAVVVTVGDVTFRTTLAVYGGQSLIGVRREVRHQAGLHVGRSALLTLQLDDAPRTVDVPEDLAEALAKDEVAAAHFERLAYTHRKEFVDWVSSARKAATREKRIAGVVNEMKKGG
jgi:hypothetical protein